MIAALSTGERMVLAVMLLIDPASAAREDDIVGLDGVSTSAEVCAMRGARRNIVVSDLPPNQLGLEVSESVGEH